MPDNKIRLTWRVGRDDRLSGRRRARADIRGFEARIVTDGPMSNFKVDIQVPLKA